MKILLISILALSLTACASDGSFNPPQVDPLTALKIAHGAMDLGANVYENLPDCATGKSVCQKPEIVAKVRPAVALADKAFTAVEGLIAQHADQASIDAAIQQAMDAIGDVNAMLGK